MSDTQNEVSVITQLTPQQQRFVQLYTTGSYSPSKVAELLEVHPNTIHNWMRREDVRTAIAELQEATHEMTSVQLKALSMKASKRMMDLMDSPIDGVALQAVKDVLDRTGHKQKTEIKVDKTVRTFEEKMQDIIESTVDEDEIEDIDFEEVHDDKDVHEEN